jgi:hypothetical protein
MAECEGGAPNAEVGIRYCKLETGNWKLARKRVGDPQTTRMPQILVSDLGFWVWGFPGCPRGVRG